jgi:hypothetical protein
MVDANFVLNLVEAIGILVGVSIAILEIRRSREERRNQLIDQVIENSRKTERMEPWIHATNQNFSSYEEWFEKYSPATNPEEAKYMYSIWTYYDVLGKHLREGLIDSDYMLSNVNPIVAMAIWEKSKVIFETWRERYNFPSFYDGFEYLHNTIKEMYPEVTYTLSPLRD